MWRRPLSQQEVVRLDVSVDDVDGVQLLHHGQDADGQVHDKRLRHQLLTQGFVDVHCILGAESDLVLKSVNFLSLTWRNQLIRTSRVP